MNRTFSTLKSNVGSNVQDTSSTTSTVIGRFVNDAYTDLLRRTNFEILDYDYTLTTDGSQDYVLPDNFGKELYVYDSTNSKELSGVNLLDLVGNYASTLNSTGTADRYVIINSKVRKQPTSASTLSIISSSSADTTQTLYIRGISNSVEMTESVVLNGTSTATSSNSYSEIISLSKSANTTGKVSITSNSGAVTVAVIPPQILNYRVKLIRLHEIPASNITLQIPYIVNPQPLLNDYDVLLIDADDIVEQGATAMAFRYKRQYAKAQEWERMYEKGITNLIWTKANQNKINTFQVMPYSRETV